MRVSQIGLIEKKLISLDFQFPVQDMLIKTGQISQFSSGIYAYGHIPYLVLKRISNVISEILTKYGCSEISLPLLQPESIWVESGRLNKYVKDGLMFRCLSDKGNYCLAPTAEEAIVSYAKSRLFSYKQLPVTYFQIGEKFRNEIRTRGFLLRGKSFLMMDAYSFGKNQTDLDIEYNNIKKAYLEIFAYLGLKVQPVGADNGAIGGNKSEEFMLITDIGEDNVLFDEKSGIAINSELLERTDAKKYIEETYHIENFNNLVSKKAVELGHIFQLGDKYAKSMNATYVSKEDKSENFCMGCYGIGVSRTLAMIYENSIIKDEKGEFIGIVLPNNIAPYFIYIIPKIDDDIKYRKAFNIYKELLNNNINVLFDDREEITIGAKIKYSKITGTPYMAIFGKTLDDNKVEVENNKTDEKLLVSVDEFVKSIKELNK